MFALVVLVLFSLQQEPGAVIAAGGGKLPGVVLEKALALGGGKGARVVIVPLASKREGAGKTTVNRFLELGCAKVAMLKGEPAAAAKQIQDATLVWMVGGSQNRLMERLRELKLVSLIRLRHRQGLAIGGSSAGAAAMSRVMLTGTARNDAILHGTTITAEGLGIVEGWIIDQHFQKRRRFARLLSCVLDHAPVRGIGIDEGTAVIFHGSGKIEVIGRSSAVVFDARAAQKQGGKKGQAIGASNILMHVLRPTRPVK